MPRRNRKEPLGLGPETGKGEGLCRNQNLVGSDPSGSEIFEQDAGRGTRVTYKRISGFRTQPDQIEILKKRIVFFEKRIENLQKIDWTA